MFDKPSSSLQEDFEYAGTMSWKYENATDSDFRENNFMCFSKKIEV